MSEPMPFVAFDDRLAEAARLEGLPVVSVSRRRGNKDTKDMNTLADVT